MSNFRGSDQFFSGHYLLFFKTVIDGMVGCLHYNRLENGKIFMLLVYAKAKTENIPAHILQDLVKELDTWQ